MNQWPLAGALFFVLCAAAALGSYVKAKLPEKHRSPETMALVQVTISLLVTFTSIVLGLLTGAVATEFQQASHNDGVFAGQLVQVDQCLRDYGPETVHMRQEFRGYVAAVLLSTWPDEPPPKDISHPDMSKEPVLGEGVSLTALLNSIRTELRELSPNNAVQEHVLADCAAEFSSFLRSRWDIVEESDQFHLCALLRRVVDLAGDPFCQLRTDWATRSRVGNYHRLERAFYRGRSRRSLGFKSNLTAAFSVFRARRRAMRLPIWSATDVARAIGTRRQELG